MAVEAPAIPVTERTTVPVSALFSEDERTMPAAPTPAAGDNDLSLTAPATAKPAEGAAPAPDVAKVAADKAAADKVAADKAAADKVAADKAAADAAAKTASTTPDAAKAAADKVAADKAAADAAAKTASTAPDAKIKIGDKEYTKQELEQALAARSATPAPAAPAAPVTPAPVPPTPEEIATAETKWCEKFVADEKLNVPVTEKEMESILAGDKDGITLLTGKLNSVVAKAVMLARKSIYQELNPVIGRLESNLQPVLVNQNQVEAASAELEFAAAYPDFKDHMATVRRVGEALLTRFPNECRAMTRPQIMAEVAAQSDRIIQDECSRFAPGKTWRELLKPAAPGAPVPDAAKLAADKAAADKVAADKAAADLAAAATAVKAPASNSPASTGTTGAPKDWHKSTAASLSN